MKARPLHAPEPVIRRATLALSRARGPNAARTLWDGPKLPEAGVFVLRFALPDPEAALARAARALDPTLAGRRVGMPGPALLQRRETASVVCHGVARAVSALMRDLPVRRLRLTRSADGKPGWADPAAPEFSIAHGGAQGCVAFSPPGRAVGVDLETRRSLDMAGIAALIFSRAEAAALAATTPDCARAALFLRYWTLREAEAKRRGIGLWDSGMRNLCLGDCGQNPIAARAGDALLQVLDDDGETVLALAADAAQAARGITLIELGLS